MRKISFLLTGILFTFILSSCGDASSIKNVVEEYLKAYQSGDVKQLAECSTGELSDGFKALENDPVSKEVFANSVKGTNIYDNIERIDDVKIDGEKAVAVVYTKSKHSIEFELIREDGKWLVSHLVGFDGKEVNQPEVKVQPIDSIDSITISQENADSVETDR